jgi:hypothetical protein
MQRLRRGTAIDDMQAMQWTLYHVVLSSAANTHDSTCPKRTAQLTK